MAVSGGEQGSRWSERELIAHLTEIFAESNSDVLVGIGDDAAVVARPQAQLVMTTDMAVEDVHFRIDWSNAIEIGRKITAANLADIFAMGGVPKFLTVAMAATGSEDLEWMLDIARGIAEEARKVGAQVIGGDLSNSNKVVISITVIGECPKPVLRSGALVADGIYITDLPGWSAAGLLALKGARTDLIFKRAIAAHKSPVVDYQKAKQIAASANSLCDISDSLLIQGEQVAAASGVQFEIDGNLISNHPDFAALSEVAQALDVSPFELILSGGEDHVFLATLSVNDNSDNDFDTKVKGFAHRIGTVKSGSGIRLLHVATPQPGWQHFQS